MKKKLSFLTIAMCCLFLVGFCIGVFAAKKVTYSLGGTIEYIIDNAEVTVNTAVYGYTSGELLDGGQAYEMMEELKTTNLNARTVPQGLTKMSFDIPEFTNTDTPTTSCSNEIDITYGDGENQSYAYFVVINIQNNNQILPAYAIAGEIVNPSNSWHINSSGYSSIYYGDTKNVVFAFGLEDKDTDETDQTVSFELHIGAMSDNQNLTYDEFDDENLTCTVTGLEDYENYPSPIVVVPNTHTVGNKTYKVTAVNGPLVGYDSPVTGIVFGDNVESITDAADAYDMCTSACDMLTTVVFSESENLTDIEYWALSDQRLYSINIPKYINQMFFVGYNEISVLYIPENITSGICNYVEDEDYYKISYEWLNETTGGVDFVRVNENNTSYTSMVDGEHINAILSDDKVEMYLASNYIKYIPNTVDTILYSFCNLEKLTELTIPSSIKNIEGSFDECPNLSKVYADSLEFWLNINFAWDNCNPLWTGNASLYIDNQVVTSVTIPNDRITLNDYVFYGYKKLTTVIFEEDSTLETLTGFRGTGITSITVPKSVTSINSYAFNSCESLGEINFEEDVNIEEIQNGTFSGLKSLLNLQIPKSVKTINSYAFSCQNLTEITFEEGSNLQLLKTNAFSNLPNLTKLELPAGITGIDKGAISRYLTKLEELTIPFLGNAIGGSVTHFGHIFGASSYYNNSSYVPTSLKKVTVNSGIICKNAFSYCKNIEVLEILDGVTSMDAGVLEGGDYGLKNLKELTIPFAGNDEYGTKDGTFNYLFTPPSTATSYPENLAKVTVRGGRYIHEYAFYMSCSLDEFIIGNTIESIAYCSFDYRVSKITFEEGSNLKVIGDNVFGQGNSLASVTLPDSVEYIGASAFMNSGISEFIISENSKLKRIGASAFDSLNIEQINLPSSLTYIGLDAFAGTPWLDNLSADENGFKFAYACDDPTVKFLMGVDETLVPTQITSSHLQGVQLIYSEVFSKCTNLTSIELPTTLKFIGQGAFDGCSALETIKINSECENIDSSAFYGTKWFNNLTADSNGLKIVSAYDDASVKFLLDAVESSVPTAVTSSMLSGVKIIYENVFNNFANLTSIEIPETVVSIGALVFDSSGITDIKCNIQKDTYSLVNGKLTVKDMSDPLLQGYFRCSWYYDNVDMLIQEVDFLTEFKILKSHMFWDCANLTSISIPDSVEKISGTIVDSEQVRKLKAIKCNIQGDTYSFVNGKLIISEMKNEPGYSFPEWYNDGINQLVMSYELPQNCSKIVERCFCGSEYLKDISIPSSVTSIGNMAFYGTPWEDNLTIQNGLKIIESSDNSSVKFLLEAINLSLPSDGIITADMLDGVNIIADRAFSSCNKITSVILPSSIVGIGSYAFAWSSNLTEVTFNHTSGSLRIDSSAFISVASGAVAKFAEGTTWTSGTTTYTHEDTPLLTDIQGKTWTITTA